ncbi:hypothetical protein NESM_000112100 [Novymonas esmeraldas]|uniref:Uncharacterized protein n=1 Tax=Novymonas esmeraldas TaxID=1808958 RepID=A0AAW0F5Z3_9TRYP
MASESDEETYTVHEVPSQGQETVPPLSVRHDAPVAAEVTSPLARYHKLGTTERHAFDEHMRDMRRQAAAAERERRFRAAHPFQPTTTSTAAAGPPPAPVGAQPSRARSPTSAAPPSDTAPPTSHSGARPVFDRLAAQAVQLEMRRRHREEQQRRAEAASLRDAFQPRINHTAPIYAERLQHLDTVTVEERLLHYGEFVARERQRKQELKEMEEAAARRTAQASVIGGGANTAAAPTPEERRRRQEAFHTRSDEFLVERDKHRHSAESAAAAAFSFQPKISATSAALDAARQRLEADLSSGELGQLLSRSVDGTTLSVARSSARGSHRSDALYALAVTRQRDGKTKATGAAVHGRDHNSSREEASTATGGAAAATHQPVTNPTSEKWIANGAHHAFFQQGFVQRQSLYEDVRREEAQLRAVATQSTGSYPGWSGDGGTGASAGGAAAAARKVDAKELSERLYYTAARASEKAEQRRREEAEARDGPFRPQLSPGTQYVLRRMSATRDADVVRRLTGQRAKSASRGADSAVDSTLYAPAPARAASVQGRQRVAASQQRRRTAAAAATSGRQPHQRPSSARAMPSTQESDEGSRNADNNNNNNDATVSAPPRPSTGKRRPPVTRDDVEHFYQRQMTAVQQRQDLLQERKEGEAVQQLVECTFRPRTNTDRGPGAAGDAAAPVSRMTGVAEFLERQAAARLRKAEHDELLRTMGLPRTKGPVSASAGGPTLLSPFSFKTETRRQRSSCSPAHASTSPLHNFGEQRSRSGSSSGAAAGTGVSTAALTAAERALHDAIEEARVHPRGLSRAPLSVLPGYVDGEEEEDDAVYFDNPYDTAALESATHAHLFAAPCLERQPPAATGRSDFAPDRQSLFSSIAPNTFTGRSLSSVWCEQKRGSSGREVASGHARPSALKSSTPRLSASARRRRRHRSVSFVRDSSDVLPSMPESTHMDAAHLDFLSGRV